MSENRTSILNEMQLAAQSLLDVLEREQQAYADTQPMSVDRAASMEALSQQKLQRVKQLEALEKQRQSLPGCQSALDASENASEGNDPQWRTIRDTLSKCRQLNELIGANIVAQANYTQRAVDILSGGESGNATVYSAEGRASSSHASRALGRA